MLRLPRSSGPVMTSDSRTGAALAAEAESRAKAQPAIAAPNRREHVLMRAATPRPRRTCAAHRKRVVRYGAVGASLAGLVAALSIAPLAEPPAGTPEPSAGSGESAPPDGG